MPEHSKENLEFYLKRIDEEAGRFEDLLEELKSVKKGIAKSIANKGLHAVLIKLTPHAQASSGLIEDVELHVIELNKARNRLLHELHNELTEQAFTELKREYGNDLNVKKHSSSDFELDFTNEATLNAFSELKDSKRMLQNLKDKFP